MKESQGGVLLPPSSEQIQKKFDLGIWFSLSTWSSLTIAVQNSWGGPESLEKRDWFAGAVSDLIASTPNADVEFVEEFLLQVMNDEFDCNVDDESGEEIAAKIVGLRKMTLQGDFTLVDEMSRVWQDRRTKGGNEKINFQRVDRGDDEDDTDWDSDDIDGVEDEDVEMGGDTPNLVKAQREKVQPKMDDEGFTEVVGKRRRRS